MTAKEKLEANEKKIQIYNARNGTCEVCSKIISQSEAQLAHRICKSKPNLKKYGADIIHHRLNLVLTCSDKFNRCNDSVNISNDPMAVTALLEKIQESNNY